MNDKTIKLEQELKLKTECNELTNFEIRGYQDKISQIESELSQANLYKDWYQDKIAELEAL